MEDWEIDFKWLEVRHKVKRSTQAQSLPDLRTILFLIGLQEYGRVQDSFSKEEKQDLMHVAACSLLETEGYYSFAGRDEDGWPHFEIEKPFKIKGAAEQEKILKKNIIIYFRKLEVGEEE